jgi:hypothetical protein
MKLTVKRIGMATLPPDFFTPASIGTLTGATGLCFVMTNGIRKAFGVNPKWLGLLVAQLIAFAGASLTHGTLTEYILAIPNGFLIFSTAAGAASITSRTDADDSIGFSARQRRRTFWGSWF